MFNLAKSWVVLILLGGYLILATAAEARPRIDWLQYDPRLAADYQVTDHATDTARQTVAPVWAKDKSARHRVLLLVAKRSVTAYSVSVSTILSTFRDREVAAEFTVWNMGAKDEIGNEAVLWAENNDIDLIVTVGSTATAFIHKHYRGGKLPVVTSASKDPTLLGQMPGYESGSGTNIAYTSINIPIQTQMVYLQQLIPRLANIAVLYAEKNISAVQTQVKPLEAISEQYGFTLYRLAVQNGETAPEDLKAGMPGLVEDMRNTDPTLKNSIFWITGSTSVYDQIAIINSLADGTPVLAALPDVVQSGGDSAAVSIGVNQSSAVHLAALYAIDILAGRAAAGELPVGVISPPDIAINFRKVREAELIVPFNFFESATFVYDYDGRQVRAFGQAVDLIN